VPIPPRALVWLLASSLAIGALAAPPAAGQLGLPKALSGGEAKAPAERTLPDAAAIEQRRREVAAERAALAQRAAAGADAGPGAEEPGARAQVSRLERLERLYARQLDTLRRLEGQAELLAEVDRQIAAGPQAALGAEPPYPLDRLDQLLDAQAAQRERRTAAEAALAEAERSLADARRDLEERETARRAAREAAGAATGEAEQAAAQRTLRVAELNSDIGRERVVAEELALAAARGDLEIVRRTERALADQIEFVEDHLALDEHALDERFAELERAEFALRDEQAEAAQAVKAAERRLAAVQKRADAEAQPSPALLAELEARRLGLFGAQRRATAIDEELERIEELRRLLAGRVRVLSGALSREELRAWARELPALDADRQRDRRQIEARIADAERERALLQARSAGDAEEQRWLAEQAREIDAALARAREQLAGLAENDRASQRLARALGVREERATLADRAGDAADAVAAVWSKELIAVEDSPITIGKVLTAILVFGLGIWVSRAIARGLAALVRRRSALDEGAITAVQSLLSYALIALFFLIALRSVNIPLTAFAVAGGALAIGIGFGSQAVVNNFVSGLILMVERPIKVGDLVVFDGASGRVERIGPRSTRIRTFDNVHLIVPNSKLLENNVVNWTLSDDVVRTRVFVGVAYGSPTREVQQLLLQLVAAQPDVLENPPPVVLLEDFAADALQFQIDFWLKLSPLVDQRVVRSNLRHAIDEAFRARGYTIAFPQRDVHLDASRPIPVRVVRDGEGADA
jgi:small-conductance mechanosensitive channel